MSSNAPIDPSQRPTTTRTLDRRTLDRIAHSTVDLSIIIVSWNGWDLLRACLQSIQQASRTIEATAQHAETQRAFGPPVAQTRLEVIVVDNASEDATADLLPARFPWVRLIRNENNVGFSAANNIGYAAATGRTILFLNPDTEVLHPNDPKEASWQQDSLWQLYLALSANPRLGLVGPQLRYADNSLQSSRRRFPTRWTGFFESTWLGQTLPFNPWSRRLHMADWPATISHEVDWVMGAAMLAQRKALEAIRPIDASGPWDEGFFMYHEEVDLCLRLKEAGWQIAYIPQSKIIHYEGRSSDKVPAARYIHFNRSKVRYYEKHFGGLWAGLMYRFLRWEFRIQWTLEGVKWLLGHKRPLRVARMRVYRAVLTADLHPSSEPPT